MKLIWFSALTPLALAAGQSTNYCIGKANVAKNCFQSATPTAACCTAVVNDFNNQGCFCNRISVGLLGTTPTGPPSVSQVMNVLGKCGAVPFDCKTYGSKTYNGGTCPVTDQMLDFYRFVNVKEFSDELLTFPKKKFCFAQSRFLAKTAAAFKSDAIAYAGQGLGIYQGVDRISEYFSLLSPRVNKGFLRLARSSKPDVDVTISPDGKRHTIGLTVTNLFADGTYSRNASDYLEMTFGYLACETLASTAYVPVTATGTGQATGVAALTEMLYKTVNFDKVVPSNTVLPLLGIVSICKQHTKYCVGTNSQFASEAACLSYYQSIPRYSTVCGLAALASGHSVTCRAKHQFMAQISPDIHCQHLGPNSESCQDSKCESPGYTNLVDITNYPPAMVTAMSNYAQSISATNTAVGWPYSDYCPTNQVVLPGSSWKMVIPNKGDLYGINTVGQVYSWDGKKWNYHSSGVTQLTACPNGSLFGTDSQQRILQFVNNAWVVVQGSLVTLACGFDGVDQNAVYGINFAGNPYKFVGNGWIPIATVAPLGAKVGTLGVGGGMVWAVDSTGKIYNKTPASNSFQLYTLALTLDTITASDYGFVGRTTTNKIWKLNAKGQFLGFGGDYSSVTISDDYMYVVDMAGTAKYLPFKPIRF